MRKRVFRDRTDRRPVFAVNRRLENIALDTGKQCAAVFRIARIIAEVGKRYPIALADIDTARTGTRRSEIDIRVGVAVKEFGVVVASLYIRRPLPKSVPVIFAALPVSFPSARESVSMASFSSFCEASDEARSVSALAASFRNVTKPLEAY